VRVVELRRPAAARRAGGRVGRTVVACVRQQVGEEDRQDDIAGGVGVAAGRRPHGEQE
jgi:hypothetical protein